jgi:hypothetical protein
MMVHVLPAGTIVPAASAQQEVIQLGGKVVHRLRFGRRSCRGRLGVLGRGVRPQEFVDARRAPSFSLRSIA